MNEKIDKRRLKGLETKEMLLQSAISAIGAEGLSNLTLDKVAQTVNVSRAAVIFHFRTKDELIEEVLLFLGSVYELERAKIASREFGNTMENILAIVDFDIRFAYKNPVYLSAWHAFWGESKVKEVYRLLGVPKDKRYARQLKQLLSILIKEKNHDKSELPIISNTLSSILFGFWLKRHLDPRQSDYLNGKKAVRLYLSKVFTKHKVPGYQAK